MERLAAVEVKTEVLERTLTTELAGIWTAIEAVRKQLLDRPSWSIVALITFLSSTTVGLAVALAAGMTR